MPAEFNNPETGPSLAASSATALHSAAFEIRDDRMNAIAGDRLKPGLVDIDSDDPRPALGKMHSRFPAEPRRSAGDDYDTR